MGNPTVYGYDVVENLLSQWTNLPTSDIMALRSDNMAPSTGWLGVPLDLYEIGNDISAVRTDWLSETAVQGPASYCDSTLT